MLNLDTYPQIIERALSQTNKQTLTHFAKRHHLIKTEHNELIEIREIDSISPSKESNQQPKSLNEKPFNRGEIKPITLTEENNALRITASCYYNHECDEILFSIVQKLEKSAKDQVMSEDCAQAISENLIQLIAISSQNTATNRNYRLFYTIACSKVKATLLEKAHIQNYSRDQTDQHIGIDDIGYLISQAFYLKDISPVEKVFVELKKQGVDYNLLHLTESQANNILSLLPDVNKLHERLSKQDAAYLENIYIIIAKHAGIDYKKAFLLNHNQYKINDLNDCLTILNIILNTKNPYNINNKTFNKVLAAIKTQKIISEETVVIEILRKLEKYKTIGSALTNQAIQDAIDTLNNKKTKRFSLKTLKNWINSFLINLSSASLGIKIIPWLFHMIRSNQAILVICSIASLLITLVVDKAQQQKTIFWLKDWASMSLNTENKVISNIMLFLFTLLQSLFYIEKHTTSFFAEGVLVSILTYFGIDTLDNKRIANPSTLKKLFNSLVIGPFIYLSALFLTQSTSSNIINNTIFVCLATITNLALSPWDYSKTTKDNIQSIIETIKTIILFYGFSQLNNIKITASVASFMTVSSKALSAHTSSDKNHLEDNYGLSQLQDILSPENKCM